MNEHDEYIERLRLQNRIKRWVYLRVCLDKLPPEQAVPLLFLMGLRGLYIDLLEKMSLLDHLEEAKKIQNCLYALHWTQHYFLEEWELLELFEYYFKRFNC